MSVYIAVSLSLSNVVAVSISYNSLCLYSHFCRNRMVSLIGLQRNESKIYIILIDNKVWIVVYKYESTRYWEEELVRKNNRLQLNNKEQK